MWERYRSRGRSWTAWLLPIATLLTGVFAWYIMKDYTGSIGSFWPHTAWVTGVIGVTLLLWIRATGGTDGMGSDRSELVNWIKEHGREIPTAEWQSTASASAQLYEVSW